MRQCSVCVDPDLNVINQEYARNTPYRVMQQRWTKFSLGTLSRHREHIRDLIRAATAERTEQAGGELLARINHLIAATQKLLDESGEAKDRRSAISAIGALTRLLELFGRTSGELTPSGGASIHLHQTRITNTVNNYEAGSDVELAQLVGEATLGFDIAEFERLKMLAQPPVV